MKKYLGVKIVEAEPMSEAAFINQVKNEDVPENCLRREGYKVVYEDGYISWSPKDVFEKAYREIPANSHDKLGLLIDPKNGEWDFVGHVAKIEMPGPTKASKFFPFGTAIEELKVGKKVARTGWNGRNTFLFYISENMYSQIGGWTFTNGRCDNYELCPFIAMKTADEKVVPWLASQTDILAEDWQIVE